MSDEKEKDLYIDMNDKDALQQAKANVDSYDGVMSAGASYRRSYLDIEDGISVRTSYRKDDYYRFRTGEQPPNQDKEIIAKCMNAYEKVGIIKNVIDLMGDFGSQGITLVHPDKNAQKFYRRWWEEVGGAERSERFLNTLFRCGNVVIKRRYAKLTKTVQRQMTRGEDDVIITKDNLSRRRIPFVYDFLNPLTIDVVGGRTALFTGNKKYKLKLSTFIKKAYESKEIPLNNLSEEIKRALKNGDSHIELDSENLLVFHYKKDDWQVWAFPMVNAILDDITMLEKMKLADMSALDGAISNIRLWRLGDFDHKILPTKNAIDKLRNILASNVGGGTMDLVWGPELDFKESNTQIFKFLGTEKYQPVLNSIYAGLGIPPTLTGIAGNGGGYTNNFVSLKTLIERLEYGRDLLSKFWNGEIRKVQKAMGFAQPAKIHFDNMILSDESAEKSLLVQLADRDIVSIETVRERFGEISDIEDARIKTENRGRKSKKVPPKTGPYHNAQIEDEYKKIGLNKDVITIDQVTDLKPKPEPVVQAPTTQPQDKKPNTSENPEGGRPKNSFDTQPRKRKVVNPRTNASLLIWATNAQKQISEMLQPALLAHYGKSNIRKLTKQESEEVELSKFVVLANLDPYVDISQDIILNILESSAKIKREILVEVDNLIKEYVDKNSKSPSVEDMRQIYCLAYSYVKSALS
jgi:hypothetical protein